MLSAAEQRNVWEGWLGAEIRANYFADLCGHYQRLQRLITWATLLASSGAVAALLGDTGSALPLILAAATAALSIWNTVQTYGKRSTDCSDLHFRWYTLALAYEDLWNDMYQPESAAVLSALRQKEVELSSTASSSSTDVRLMLKWEDHVIRHHASRLPA